MNQKKFKLLKDKNGKTNLQLLLVIVSIIILGGVIIGGIAMLINNQKLTGQSSIVEFDPNRPLIGNVSDEISKRGITGKIISINENTFVIYADNKNYIISIRPGTSLLDANVVRTSKDKNAVSVPGVETGNPYLSVKDFKIGDTVSAEADHELENETEFIAINVTRR